MTRHQGILVYGVFLLSLIMLASPVVAKTEITVGIQWDINIFNGVFPVLADAYMESHPDVKVEILESWGDQKILTAAAGGALPDIIFGWGRAEEFQEIFLPLDKLMEINDIKLDNYLPGAASQMHIGGKTWVLQIFIDPNFPLLYNKTILAESGIDRNSPPQTTKEFDMLCPKLIRRTNDGNISRIAMPVWLSGYHTAGLLSSWSAAFGVNIWEGTSSEGYFNLTSPRMVAALEWLRDHQERYEGDASGILGAGRWSIDRLVNGVQVMSYEVTPYYKNICSRNPAYEWGISPPIYEEEHGFKYPIWFGGWPAGVTRQSENPDAAFDFLAFMSYSEEGQRIQAEVGELFPGIKNSPGFEVFIEQNPEWLDFIRALNTVPSEISAPGYYFNLDWGTAYDGIIWQQIFAEHRPVKGVLMEAQRFLETEAVEQGIKLLPKK